MGPVLLLIPILISIDSGAARTDLDQKAEKSLQKMFGDTAAIGPRDIRLTPDERTQLEEKSRARWRSDSLRVYVCTARGRILGYGVADNVRGKTNFITYLVGILTDGTVRDIDILAYRESYGGEIANESFRRQFQGKTKDDRLIPGRDIKNISGATISVHAITDGVRKILATFALIRSRLL